MKAVSVEITRWVDDYQPGIVECRLVDAYGKVWHFVDKLPYFTATYLGPESEYPQPGTIACEIERKWLDESGRDICLIDTDRPWCIEATSGETCFDVLATQLCEQ